MKTLTDINRSARGPVTISVDSVTPEGHFLATVNMLGILTTYLLVGEEGTLTAPIKGRVEVDNKKKCIRAYSGEQLKGGVMLSTNTYEESFLAMV